MFIIIQKYRVYTIYVCLHVENVQLVCLWAYVGHVYECVKISGVRMWLCRICVHAIHVHTCLV